MVERTLLDTAAASSALGITSRELSNLARIGKGPAFVQLGGARSKRWYSSTDLEAWKRRQSTPEERTLFSVRPNRTYTVEDVCRLTGLAKGVVFARARHGKLPAPMGLAKVGGARKHVWAADAVDSWLSAPPGTEVDTSVNEPSMDVKQDVLARLVDRVESLGTSLLQLIATVTEHERQINIIRKGENDTFGALESLHSHIQQWGVELEGIK